MQNEVLNALRSQLDDAVERLETVRLRLSGNPGDPLFVTMEGKLLTLVADWQRVVEFAESADPAEPVRRRKPREGQWPILGDVVLVQDLPTTDAQRELWANRQPPTRKGEVVETPADGISHLTIDVGGEYGGVTYPAREFGYRYAWKPAGESRGTWDGTSTRDALAANGHMMTYRITGYREDGSPRLSQHDAVHSDLCACMDDNS
ncbi:hypothetical protein E6R60_26620 [Streptomyces sp. A0642]|uniref:hypothetical protein n=1 Tax=Streptomyces sp. A0642 TaxID=2563100 RepID=UPI0010A2163A|nr:hypothetical protein [Streptomyces sp. A0642]THA72507.1 hypothetical protein E6R60_26620 [Streptomyces sp. A0642]